MTFFVRNKTIKSNILPKKLTGDFTNENYMALMVAKQLNIDPTIILKNWTYSKLAIIFSFYANSESERAYYEYLSSKGKYTPEQPRKTVITFRRREEVIEYK